MAFSSATGRVTRSSSCPWWSKSEACWIASINRSSAFAIELNRLLERAIVKSRCVDVEELCVRSGERCWTLRVEATALNNEGNLSDTLCLAAIGALMHFRRPDVTVDGTEVTVHDSEEKEPVKLTLHHKPFTVTMGYTAEQKEGEDKKIIILDPSRQEEVVLSGALSVAINKHREVRLKYTYNSFCKIFYSDLCLTFIR